MMCTGSAGDSRPQEMQFYLPFLNPIILHTLLEVESVRFVHMYPKTPDALVCTMENTEENLECWFISSEGQD